MEYSRKKNHSNKEIQIFTLQIYHVIVPGTVDAEILAREMECARAQIKMMWRRERLAT